MGSIDEKIKTGGLICGAQGLLGDMKLLKEMQDHSGIRKAINSELWHACAGPLVSLPRVGSLVYYFPQGHSEQVAVSTKCAATSQIPNYPNLPSQLMCQVHSVTMHADKDTDEVYAQMSLQPVNSEKDVFPIPDFGLRPSKHPSEFFCKTLTASDTSTHGGFSVPRRAAEKLFPPLDYAMQPPTQELVVHDLHDNTWTFRHIYRGQPKRHLLTTGWSLFISAKRLKAGDAVLFIRDEKSQLLLGVRHANRQQTTLPSSVLSADSMHIGVLAAAAHATANHSPFTIFYNPRACPSEFVIPLPKYRKSVYGTQVTAGVRFGMMFETEESGRRRYMGTVVGISDLDPLRWPGSKWRNLQVEWDEPGCCDRQMRVSTWEIETPESLFIFPSLTSGLKRSLHSGAETEWGKLIKRPFIRAPGNGIGDHPYPSMSSSLCSEQLLNMLLKPQLVKPSLVHSENTSIQGVNHPQSCNGQSDAMKPTWPSQTNPPKEIQQLTKSDDQMPAGTTENLKIEPQCDGGKLPAATINQPMALDQNSGPLNLQSSHWFVPPQLESSIHFPRQDEVSQLDCISPNPVLPYVDSDGWTAYAPSSVFGLQDPSIILPGAISPTFPSTNHEMWDHHHFSFNSVANSGGLKGLSKETDQSGTYSCLNYVDPSISSTILDDFGALKDSDFQNHPDCLISNFSSSQDVQSQITSASLTDSRAFSKQDFPDSSGVTSSSNVDFDDSSLLQSNSWKQVPPPLRTYTKVQKAGSVGRSIDVASFKNYEELCSAIEHMFGLEGLLNDPRSSGWKLVYVDYENDVLLVGDDPWEVFVGCVRCIRILSPSEVQQMSEEGMQLLNSAAAAQVQAMNDSI